jgi:hypothetical protein
MGFKVSGLSSSLVVLYFSTRISNVYVLQLYMLPGVNFNGEPHHKLLRTARTTIEQISFPSRRVEFISPASIIIQTLVLLLMITVAV